MLSLFRIRGFLPYVAMLFLNAFVDLGHKIIIQNTVFKLHSGGEQSALIAIVNALILLPFILLFSPAGFLSNRYAKPRVMQLAAWSAIGVTLLITGCYAMGWFKAAFVMTLILAAKSAIYSPAKYGYIREIAGSEELTSANGVVQATTTIAILSGMFVFSALFEHRLAGHEVTTHADMLQLMAPLGWLLVANSVVELLLAYRLPVFPREAVSGADAGAPPSFDRRAYLRGEYLRRNLGVIRAHRGIWLAIVGLATYWGLAQALIAVFPAFAEARLHERNTVVIQALLAATGIGVMLGSLLAGRLSRAHIETGLIPVGAAGLALSLALLPLMHSTGPLVVLMLAIGLAGGLFVVPLNALVQYHAPPAQSGTILAGNNWVQNVTMLGFLLVTASASWLGLSSSGMFVLLTVVAIGGAGYTIAQLPQSLVRVVLSGLFRSTYRVDVLGFEHLPREGAVLLLGNHISWIDWAMVQIACPRPIRFVMQKEIYNQWYLKPFMKAVGAIPIASGSSKAALEQIHALLKNGEVVCLFPEGAISRTGQLGEFRHGYERTVEDVDGVIIPFYLHGLWGSRLSRASSKLHENRSRGMKRNILVAFGDPLPMDTKADALKQAVAELSIGAWQAHTDWLKPLPLAWLHTAKRQGNCLSVADSSGNELSHYRLMAAVLCFTRRIRQQCQGPNVGLLVPTTSAGIIANMAALLAGKTAVNLNFSASAEAVAASAQNAGIQQIVTSKLFLKKLEQKNPPLAAWLATQPLLYLEEVGATISQAEKLLHLLAAMLLPANLLYRLFGTRTSLDDPAAILFSSGSEGIPKGIVLSHRNIVANCMQVSDVLNTRDSDVVMGSLPLFHSFGLTVTAMMPLLEGVPVVCHPDPTDVLAIAKAIARYDATLLCGTSTFLRLYVKNSKIHPLMLRSLRIVVAGAEKLSTDVREAFRQKFGLEIYEGYGATETTPVASVNIPDQLDTAYWHVQTGQKTGTVGMPLPGTAFRIVDPHTLQTLPSGEDGLILIAGTQVMLGYLNDEAKTAAAIVELDGHRWYKTGDKGHLDKDGFLSIVDRYSRFAKIGGEMISLGAVEENVRRALAAYNASLAETELVAVNLPDDRKGEKIVLLYAADLPAETVRAQLIAAEMPGIMLPAEYRGGQVIPKLGSGKTDFSAAKALALRETTTDSE